VIKYAPIWKTTLAACGQKELEKEGLYSVSSSLMNPVPRSWYAIPCGETRWLGTAGLRVKGGEA
jgi:hypothetical protein